MHITRLLARDFLNLEIDTPLDGVTVLQGANGMGKTNFLEAIYFAALGRPMRVRPGQLVRTGADDAHVRVIAENDGVAFRVDVFIAGAKKHISVDGNPIRRTHHLYGKLLVVAFLPCDMRLVYGGPAERRRFLDMEICQISPVYVGLLSDYHRALRQRGVLLRKLRAGDADRGQIEPWDAILAQAAGQIVEHRAAFLAGIYNEASRIHKDICADEMSIKYLPNTPAAAPDEFMARLAQRRDRDVRHGITGMGPHLDDFGITLGSGSARGFGSQGQARCAALAIKLGLVELIVAKKGVRPITLLDDCLSELDADRAAQVLRRLSPQTIITTALKQDIQPTTLQISHGKVI